MVVIAVILIIFLPLNHCFAMEIAIFHCIGVATFTAEQVKLKRWFYAEYIVHYLDRWNLCRGC